MATIIGSHQGALETLTDQLKNEVGTLIMLDSTDSSGEFNPLEEAINLAHEGEPVVLLSWHTQFHVGDLRFHGALGSPHTAYAILPQSMVDLRKLLSAARNGEGKTDILALSAASIQQVGNEMGVLRHDLPHALRRGEEATATWTERAKAVLGNRSSDELQEKVRTWQEKELPVALELQNFPDFCVDVEGTLIQGDLLNKELVAEIEREEKKRPITLWTGGDLKETNKLIRSFGLPWKLLSKWWLRGATVATAVDDLPYDQFFSEYGIKVSDYRQV